MSQSVIHVVGFITVADVGRSLSEAFFMFWETLWALILGFTLSGVVQAFVSKDQMQSALGDHGPRSVLRASGLGMVSSSCSYAATAMSKSLFQKGADFVSAMVFMFASTNLVLELGIVLVVLMGWQFAAAEFVGGPIMIVLLALVGGFVFRAPMVEAARTRLRSAGSSAGDTDTHDDSDDHDHDSTMAMVSDERQAALDAQGWRTKVRSKADWSDAATYSIADITMLRKELLIGYVVAGFLTVMVPMSWWNTLFISGHGFWTSVENAMIGPVIAFLSFVCSIGNVPMAAALWQGGISFGGVISFIFADLLTLPLVLIYRKYYGRRLTVRLVAVFYVVMVIAALLVEGLFSVLGLIPESRPEVVASTHFEFNYTTVLNVVFLGVLGVVYWLYRHRDQYGGGVGYAIDPVCGMQVETAHAPARAGASYFCSDGCRERFLADPAKFSASGSTTGHEDHD
jgi:uncharacterized membrane protein YraQ (UPF0718 family)/YHS domain-containing protein